MYSGVQFIHEHNIKQLITSSGLTHLHERFKRLYKLDDYRSKYRHTIYFGIYTFDDIRNIINLNVKYIIFGGTDVDLVLNNSFIKEKFDLIKNAHILSISLDIHDRLLKYGYKSTYFDLNLVDKNVFKKIETGGDCIYIYNGLTEGNEQLYGKCIYMEVIKRLPGYNYIFSNKLHVPNHKMYDIYTKCFIGLRLTEKDGNANTVQEFESIGIPIVHNLSNYGLKWNNIDDIIRHVEETKRKTQNGKIC